MNQACTTQKIQAIKALFKNICDTLSRNEIDDNKTKIYKNIKLYGYCANKTILNKKQTNRFHEIINNLNEIHEYLLNKEASIDNNAPYELDKLFEHYEYYKPILTKSSFEGNYVKYTSSGDFASSIGAYFENIKFYFSNLIYYYMLKGEWTMQLCRSVLYHQLMKKLILCIQKVIMLKL